MPEQFDLITALEKRDQGIEQVAANNDRFLFITRRVARTLARANGHVTMDEVRQYCRLKPLHPNAWGAVFKHPDFEFTGRFVQSENVSRRGGMQRVWRLKQ